jgi:hypothetical protein
MFSASRKNQWKLPRTVAIRATSHPREKEAGFFLYCGAIGVERGELKKRGKAPGKRELGDKFLTSQAVPRIK